MSKIKVTQVKSHIDRPKRQKDTLLALGLGKVNKSRIMDVNPQVQGMIDKVSHLVEVENIKG